MTLIPCVPNVDGDEGDPINNKSVISSSGPRPRLAAGVQISCKFECGTEQTEGRRLRAAEAGSSVAVPSSPHQLRHDTLSPGGRRQKIV